MKNGHYVDLWCENFLTEYPAALKQAKKFIDDKKSFGDDWPDWCGLPMSATYAIITNGAPYEIAGDIMFDIGVKKLSELTAAILWSQTKAVYRYDPEMARALTECSLTGHVPAEILYRLPFYCVYIHSPMMVYDREAEGFFAWMEYDVNHKTPELRLLFLHKDDSTTSFPVILGGGTLDESNETLFRSAIERGAPPAMYAMQSGEMSDYTKQALDNTKKMIVPAINLLMYLCADEADIKQASRRRVVASHELPKESTAWDVGVRIGAALRGKKSGGAAVNHEVSSEDAISAKSGSPRAHMRRAHWHHFWTGPRDGERKLILRWLHPVLVGDASEDLPTVVRDVEDD